MSCSCIRKEFQDYFLFPEIDDSTDKNIPAMKENQYLSGPVSSPQIVDRITSSGSPVIESARNSSCAVHYSLYPKQHQQRELIDCFINYFVGFHDNNSLSIKAKQKNLTELVISCSFDILEK
jgi:hypothetical protein